MVSSNRLIAERRYFYDENGIASGAKVYYYGYIGTECTQFDFYFKTNIQGDILAVFNKSGECLMEVTYDAWGNFTDTVSNMSTVPSTEQLQALAMPFRYRGYVYDQETELYYLNSRYYDSKMCRFINADEVNYLGANDDLIAFNLYAYCSNNPVMNSDPMGTWNLKKFFSGANLIAIGVAAVAIAVTVATCGTAGPVMLAVAATTMVAGAATVVNGTAEVVESVTETEEKQGYNFMRDGVYGGDAEAYEAFRDTTATVAEIGTMICSAYIGANGGKVCFIAGTIVLAEAGKIAIENIETGDYVWATNPDTNETELKKVVRTFENETSELVHVSINGKKITCTKEHPFYSPVKGWTAACKLKAGDMLVTVNGEYVVVEWVQHELLESPIKVYNFEVEDFHTYYVGEGDGVLVHNSCKPSNSEIKEAAENLGYTKVKGQYSHGQAIFKNDSARSSMRYITFDADSHNGGFWKAASSIKNLGSKSRRTGTFDILLGRICP